MRFMLLCGQARSVIRFRMDMLLEIKSKGHDIFVACPNDDLPELREILEKQGINFIPILFNRGGLNPLKDIIFFFRLIKLFRKQPVDKIFLYHIKPIVWGNFAAGICGITQIFCMITGLGYMFVGNGFFGKMRRVIAIFLYKASLHFSQKVFIQNPDDRKFFYRRKLCNPQKVVMVPGSGVNLEKYYPRNERPEKLTFLMVSRILRDKGVREYFSAAKLFNEVFPDKAVFNLVGPIDVNPESLTEEEIRQLSESSGVKYLGEEKTEKVIHRLHHASVFVLPSYREGTPRTNLEAMACALPVITTNAPGCSETVLNGVNGFLVPPKNSNALFEAMREFYLRPELIDKMGKCGRSMVEERFSVIKVNHILLKEMGI